MITIFWDLDGLLCDFDGYWGTDKAFNKSRFKSEVMDNKMFEKLEILDSGCRLLIDIKDYLTDNKIKYNFQILSSLGSPNDDILVQEVARQKESWIDCRFTGIFSNLNFVEHKGKKKYFATPTSILIDDTPQNVYDFNECHGHGILFNNDMDYDTIFAEVTNTIDMIHNNIKRKIY